jgi:predicted enzyme related to lactoylglutathione lyase
MTEGIQTVVYPVNDLAAAKARFTALLGVEPYADWPYYVGYKVAGQDIGLDPNGHRAGAVAYVTVADIKGRLQALIDAGAEVSEELKDVGGGRLIASVKDPDGNLIGLLQDPA